MTLHTPFDSMLDIALAASLYILFGQFVFCMIAQDKIGSVPFLRYTLAVLAWPLVIFLLFLAFYLFSAFDAFETLMKKLHARRGKAEASPAAEGVR